MKKQKAVIKINIMYVGLVQWIIFLGIIFSTYQNQQPEIIESNYVINYQIAEKLKEEVLNFEVCSGKTNKLISLKLE